MKKFEQLNISAFTEENQRREEERERKKQTKRENRLKKIVENNFQILQSLLQKEADNFEITYEEIQERYDSIFEETVEISPSRLPAYGIFLKLKSDPEKKYQIMHWFRPDLDVKKAEFDMMLNQGFVDRIKRGIEKLKSEN